MDAAALERAKRRISGAVEGRPEPAELAAALARSRDQVEALAAAAAELEAGIPAQVGHAVRDGLRTEVLPVGRHLAEIRGLFNQAIRRLERIEGDLLAERNARVDDLALLVELVTSGWRGVDARLARLERERGAEIDTPPAQEIEAEPEATPAERSPTSGAPSADHETPDLPGRELPSLPSLGRQADAIVERTAQHVPDELVVSDNRAAAA